MARAKIQISASHSKQPDSVPFKKVINCSSLFCELRHDKALRNHPDLDLNNLDEGVKIIDDRDDKMYKLDYSKSHPFDNQCQFPVLNKGGFS